MISVIICTYNREQHITKVLEALSKESFSDFEVIVVDNNSTDGTLQAVENFAEKHPGRPLKILKEPHQGLSWARNCGIKAAQGEILAFLDDDAIPRKGYLNHIDAGFQNHKEAVAFGGKIVPLFDGCSAPKWLSHWSLGWVSGLDKGDSDSLFKGKEFPIGANMGFRSSVFKKCGLFNTELGRNGGNLMGGEEKDLFNRIKATNGQIVYLHDVVVDHVIGPNRTTRDYVIRFAEGVGRSEKRRSLSEGTYPQRLLSEIVKWAGTLVLFIFYLLTMRASLATTLVLFRFHVSKELLKSKI